MSKIIPVVLATAGAILLWAAITDRNPIDVLKNALTSRGESGK